MANNSKVPTDNGRNNNRGSSGNNNQKGGNGNSRKTEGIVEPAGNKLQGSKEGGAQQAAQRSQGSGGSQGNTGGSQRSGR